MGVARSRESIDDDDMVQCEISEFEHTFAASLEDFSPGTLPDPLPGRGPSTRRSRSGGKHTWETSYEPLSGRLVTIHMLGTELVVREAVDLKDRQLISIQYAAIRQLTWDHSHSSLKIGYGLNVLDVEDEAGDTGVDPDSIFISVRVENSLELEDELKQRGMAEANRAAAAGRKRQLLPASIYLGMFAGSTKPKPFQRKRPNLSSTIPEGHLPSLQDMRQWSIEEHWGSARPQMYSNRPRLAMDAVFTGGNYFPLVSVTGLTSGAPNLRVSCKPRLGGLVLSFATLNVQLPDCDQSVSFALSEVDDWSVVDVVGKETEMESGFELWILMSGGGPGPRGSEVDPSRKGLDSSSDERHPRCRRVFLAVPDPSLVTARNSMEYYWNMSRAERKLPSMPGSTHGRHVASIVTLRGEEKAPAPPIGRLDPVNLDGVEVRVGQTIQSPKHTGQVHLVPSPRVFLGADKRKTLRYNARARQHWERVVLHQGWLKKRGGGAIKRWIWRYFVIYDTPQGHYLAYYNDVSDIPLFCNEGKERQLVDLCQVCFLRPEIKSSRPQQQQQQKSTSMPPHAFTVVTVERHWTLCAESQASLLQWLRMLSVAIDEDVAVTDDGQTTFGVRARWAPISGLFGSETAATAILGSRGMELRFDSVDPALLIAKCPAATIRGGIDSEEVVISEDGCRSKFWSYTDFFKWTIMKLKDGTKGLVIQCFRDDQFMAQEEIMISTPKSSQLALVIEHQVEKFMSMMHLRLELWPEMAVSGNPHVATADGVPGSPIRGSNQAQEDGSSGRDGQDEGKSRSPKGSTCIPAMNLETDQAAWGSFATTAPEVPEPEPSPVEINPLESNKIDDSDSEEILRDTCRGTKEDYTELLCGLTPSSDKNPCDSASPYAPEEIARKDLRQTTVPHLLGPETFETTNLTPSTVSGGSHKFFADPTPLSQPVGSSSGKGGPGAAVTSPPPFSPSTAWTSNVPVDASQPRAMGSEDGGTSSVHPSFQGLMPGAARPPKDASRGSFKSSNPFASPERDTPAASADDGTTSTREEEFDADQICDKDEPTIIHKDGVMVVTLEGIAQKGRGRVLTIDYELPCVSSGLFTVELLNDEAIPAILSSMTPPIASAPLDGENGSTRKFRQELVMTCVRPFKSSPSLRLTRSAPSQRQSFRRPSVMIMIVPLPVTVASFVSGRKMSAETFGTRWKDLGTPDQVTQETVLMGCPAGADARSSGDDRPEHVRIGDAAVRQALVDQLRFVEVDLSLQSVDEETRLIAGTGVLQTASILGNGDDPSMDCLVGVELGTRTGVAKVTVKSGNGDLAAGVLNVVVEAIRHRRGVCQK